MKNILSILLLLLAFTACGDKSSVTDVLNRAETLMNEHPDSSLALLRTLTLDDFQQESNRARYALLHSQALDKLAGSSSLVLAHHLAVRTRCQQINQSINQIFGLKYLIFHVCYGSHTTKDVNM